MDNLRIIYFLVKGEESLKDRILREIEGVDDLTIK